MSELTLARAGLVLIDVQREYFAEGGPLRIPDGPVVLARLRQLVEAAREAHLPDRPHPPRGGAGRARVRPRRPARRDDARGRSAGPRADRRPSTRPARSRTPSSSAVLTQFGVRRLVIGGFMTHMCCDSTARQAVERGLEVIFLTDGTATRDLALRRPHGPRTTTCRRPRWPRRPTASRRSPTCASVRNLLAEAAW